MRQPARVVCGCRFTIELYGAFSGAPERQSFESKILGVATKIANFLATAVDSVQGNAEAQLYLAGSLEPIKDASLATSKPAFVTDVLLPLTWKLTRTTFRKADTFTCTIPLSALPVPVDSIRSIRVDMGVEQVGDDDWNNGLSGGYGAYVPTVTADADFSGLCDHIHLKIGADKKPTIEMSFRDFLGLLSSCKVKMGVEFDHDVPISQAIAKFLVGSPAEGLKVQWVDAQPEPGFGKYTPLLHKKKKSKKATKPAKAKDSYLDAITKACGLVGCVARLNVNTVEVAFAGTLYEGKEKGKKDASKATILLGQIVEDASLEHTLLGVGTHAVQVVSYNPDTHEQYSARWPKDAGTPKTSTGAAPPVHEPVIANVGLPGYEQQDEAIHLVPFAPVSDPSILIKVAEAYYLERTRQKVKTTITTHSPWSNPDDPSTADILELQAGDRVTFGILQNNSDDALLPPEVVVLTGDVGQEGVTALLEAAGQTKTTASKTAAVIMAIPRTDNMRVEEISLSGGGAKAVDIEMVLTNYTTIISDIQAKESGEDPEALLARVTSTDAVNPEMTTDDIKNMFVTARKRVMNAGLAPAAESAGLAKIDAAEKQAMAGR